jgi:methylase of polypeptide subunit release factors
VTRQGFAALRVLADRPATDALSRLVSKLRAGGYANQVVQGGDRELWAASQLALGHPIPTEDLDRQDVQALVAAGAADLDPTRLAPRFTLFALGKVIILVPTDGGDDPGRVYFGRDSLWLADFASRRSGQGGAMADLGTGAGTVAALLAPHYDTVVGTDIVDRTAACASLTFALNPRPDGSPAATACRTDVSAGLASGSFTLVTGNPPWMPALDREVHGPERVFAEGGTTGFELPRRFILEGASLLRPGGDMVMLALDVNWANGDRPLHSLGRGLRRLGYNVAIVPTGVDEPWRDTEIDPAVRFPGIQSAEHMALTVHRPLELDDVLGSDGVVASGKGEPEEGPEQSMGGQFGGGALRAGA